MTLEDIKHHLYQLKSVLNELEQDAVKHNVRLEKAFEQLHAQVEDYEIKVMLHNEFSDLIAARQRLKANNLHAFNEVLEIKLNQIDRYLNE